MRVVATSSPIHGRRFGCEVDGAIRLLAASVDANALFTSDEEELGRLLRGSDAEVPLDGTTRLAPVPRPSKIVCVGLNYRDHADESGEDAPDAPLLFSKFPSSLIGHDDVIRWPAGLTSEVDWEGELAVVVGARLRGASPEACMDGVFGFTAANDVSARDLQFGDGQWVRGKSLDTFCPVGPSIVTVAEFGDPQDKRVRTLVNGTVMQDGSTRDMIFPVAGLLSWVCRQITLEPGDLVLTGTPPGVGAFRTPPVFLSAGDRVEVEVEDVGTLRSHVAAAP
jgi:2-keto-4-pentenoate hydratase/2-oxohepta-3-ene-1,7-dioic acid hydratase in catechol pathway